MDKLRIFVMSYPLRTTVMTDKEWDYEFFKFKEAIKKFHKENPTQIIESKVE